MKEMQNSKLKSFPDSRISTMDVCELGLKKHHIKALLEIDVTNAREAFRSIKERDGKNLSFTAWLVKCIATAVDEYKEANAFLKSSKTLVIFKDIDISITVEKEYNGCKVPLPYVIRNTNSKSVLDIHYEIRKAQDSSAEDGNVVIGQQDYSKSSMKLFLSLPAKIRRWIWKAFLLKPYTAHKNMGSVILTSVGMFGSFDGWIIPTSIHPLCFAVGTIVKKPGFINDSIAIREYLSKVYASCTLHLETSIIDLANRCQTHRLAKLIIWRSTKIHRIYLLRWHKRYSNRMALKHQLRCHLHGVHHMHYEQRLQFPFHIH